MINEILPAFRAAIARRLIKSYGMKQKQISEMLGVTQPAISQYNKGLRGKMVEKILSNENLVEYIDKFVGLLLSKNIDINSCICEICEKVRSEGIIDESMKDSMICMLDVVRLR